MIGYKVDLIYWTITPVEIERWTAYYVILTNGRRESRNSSRRFCWEGTREEAVFAIKMLLKGKADEMRSRAEAYEKEAKKYDAKLRKWELEGESTHGAAEEPLCKNG